MKNLNNIFSKIINERIYSIEYEIAQLKHDVVDLRKTIYKKEEKIKEEIKKIKAKRELLPKEVKNIDSFYKEYKDKNKIELKEHIKKIEEITGPIIENAIINALKSSFSLKEMKGELKKLVKIQTMKKRKIALLQFEIYHIRALKYSNIEYCKALSNGKDKREAVILTAREYYRYLERKKYH